MTLEAFCVPTVPVKQPGKCAKCGGKIFSPFISVIRKGSSLASCTGMESLELSSVQLKGSATTCRLSNNALEKAKP